MPVGHHLPRALTASAYRLDLGDRDQIKRMAQLRQSWQVDAWTMRRNCGELRYASAYLGNSASRMRLYPAAYVPGETNPIPAEEAGLDPALIAAAHDSLSRLGAGSPTALAGLMRKQTENAEIAGEWYLIGTVDPLTSIESWSIRSTSETVITADGKFGIRDAASGQGGSSTLGVDWLNPASTYITRMWWPDPEYAALADSPVRAVLDILEELLLLSRDVRATARARLANNGILKWPDSLEVIHNAATQVGEGEDPLLAEFMAAATASLTDEGAASTVVPIIVKGPAEALKELSHMPIERKNTENGTATRQELIGRLATGLDLPSEVLTGKADLNHWTAWQVDDDSFRHHIEPIVIVQVDALTTGFLWPDLDSRGFDPEQVRRIVVWYDPTDLVTHPDRTADALQLWDRFAINDATLRRVTGFQESDAPKELEILIRMASRLRTLDPAIQSAVLRKIDDTIPEIPVSQVPGALPVEPATGGTGGPTGIVPPPAAPVEGPPATAQPGTGTPADRAAAVRALVDRVRPAPRAITAAPPPPVPPTLAARIAAVPQAKMAACRRLTDIDRSLRDRLLTAANAALQRGLERAGAKVVTKVNGASRVTIDRLAAQGVHIGQLTQLVRATPAALIPSTVGPAIIAALGLDENAMLDAEFAELEKQWGVWVESGSQQALRAAASIAGLDVSVAYAQCAGTFADDRSAGWSWLLKAMRERATELLHDLPKSSGEAIASIETRSLLSPSAIRAALAVAGGFGHGLTSQGIGANYRPVDPTEGMGQVGTGNTIHGFLTNNGANLVGYQWVHGYADDPFEAHLELDGLIYSAFDDEPLSTADDPDWGADFYFPGDHKGCTCDFLAVYAGDGDV